MVSETQRRKRRFWLLAALAFLGIVYSVFATRYWMMSWIPLLPLMRQSFFFRLFFGPFWFAFELLPITVAVALLRMHPIHALATVLLYDIVMNVVQVASEPGGYGLFMVIAINIPMNVALQLPVWGLTRLMVRLFPRNSSTARDEYATGNERKSPQ